MLNYLVILFRCRDNSGCAFSSSNVQEPSMHLDVNHEEARDAPANDVGSLSMDRSSGTSSARDSYSSKLITEWKSNLTI